MNNAWKINDGDRTYAKGWTNKSEQSGFGGSSKPAQSSRAAAGQRPVSAMGTGSAGVA